MQIDFKSKSKSLLGATDLTLVAPIKQGLIPALDSRSYESRLRLLLKTLNTLRISSLEAEPTPRIPDTIDSIRAIHSFRLVIVAQQPQPLLVLAVVFDGGWEPYMRRIWRDLGPLLDVIFCNCDDYLSSNGHSFAQYAGWVRSAQVDTEFFYSATSLTVNDLHYVREQERSRRDRVAPPAPAGDALAQALPALAALYRLTDMYPPLAGVDDGACLLRAALHLLHEQATLLRGVDPNSGQFTASESAALRWFATAKEKQSPPAVDAPWDATKTQGGIIEPYAGITHGCLLLLELKDAAAALALLQHPRSGVIKAGSRGTGRVASPFVNLAFTLQGLQITGVPTGTLEQLPSEFREGMAARAAVLGDLRYNHPTRWPLPRRNWRAPAQGEPDRVQLSSVHAIVQYACRHSAATDWQELTPDSPHPLAKVVQDLEQDLGSQGVRILSVQAMQRDLKTPGELPRGHFGFVDGVSQPTLDSATSAQKSGYSDKVMLGDLLLGYENSLGDKPLRGRLWLDSTFLVVRKLRQDVEAFNAVLPADEQQAKVWKAKLMGRGVDGENLIDPKRGNHFDYKEDPQGALCPLQSHARRANPRTPRDSRSDMRTVPRIMRRGMSYGPFGAAPQAGAERGLMFMAYNASIAEQFEVIQSWLSGGNSSSQHSYSALRDPFIGVPQDDDPVTFEYRDDKKVEQRLNLASDRPFVQLEWGVYAFVPSIRALAELQEIAREAAAVEAPVPDPDSKRKKDDQRAIQLAMQSKKGAAVIARLRAVEQALGFEAAKEQWKIALEDVSARMSGTSQAVWAAVRQLHGGALRTPYGVLVCSKKLVMEVFDNSGRFYTATGYAERMRKSFGEIYLGMDDGPKYDAESREPNAAVQSVSIKDGFVSAFGHMQSTVKRLLSALQPGDEVTVDVKDIVDEVLASISTEWFGLPDGGDVVAGGWHWRKDTPPTCPGHFHSPSRHMFQPNPGTDATETGERHGKALVAAVKRFVGTHRALGHAPTARLGRAIFDAIPGDDERLTRTLIGVMMGFLPTVDGNLRGALYEWINDRSLWDHQIAYRAHVEANSAGTPVGKAFASARSKLLPPLRRMLLLRPVPELAWRIALARHSLGNVDVNPGETVVLSIVSATQECLINDDLDLYPMFGGDRGAAAHPTHACPGYKMALGVMLGTLAGLLESARMKPAISPMALRLTRLA